MIHGKQIKDYSINLNKLSNLTGQTLTLLGTSKIQQTIAPSDPLDLVNKQYVDGLSVSANNGLNVNSGIIRLGGPLLSNTDITGAFDLNLGTSLSKLNSLNINIGNSTEYTQFVFSNSQIYSFIGFNDQYSYCNIDQTSFRIAVSDSTGSDENAITFYNQSQTIADGSNDNTMIIEDWLSEKGLVYAEDYSGNFTEESLVTKRYVDDSLTGGGPSATPRNKNLQAFNTTTAGEQLCIAIQDSPFNMTYLQVFINGIKVSVALQGAPDRDVYFADPGSLNVVKLINQITAGDVLVRGNTLGFDTDSSDIIDIDYLI